MSKWIRSRNWTAKRDFYLKELTQDGVKLEAATYDEQFWIKLEVSELKQFARYSRYQKNRGVTNIEFSLTTVNNNPKGFSSWARQLEGVVQLTGERRSLAFGHQKQLGHQTRYPIYISCLDTDQRLGPGELNPDHPEDPDDFLELEASTYGEEFKSEKGA